MQKGWKKEEEGMALMGREDNVEGRVCRSKEGRRCYWTGRGKGGIDFAGMVRKAKVREDRRKEKGKQWVNGTEGKGRG